MIKRKYRDKLFTNSFLISTVALLGLYLDNTDMVKADSLSTEHDYLNIYRNTNNNYGSANEDSETEIKANVSSDQQTSISSIEDFNRSDQDIHNVSSLTESTISWNGINVTFDEANGILSIPGGPTDNPVVLNNPIGIYSVTENYDAIKEIKITGKISIKGSARELFAFLHNVTSISGLNNLDTSEVSDMSEMFVDCTKITSLDVSSFDTSKVKSTALMFSYCENLTSLDISNFNTSNVTEMFYMFSECTQLASLKLGSLNTSNVEDMSYMFFRCGSLTNLDVSSFDTSNVQKMSYMFEGCENLTSLVVNNFNTSNVTDMSGMFCACEKLTRLDLSNFDMSNVPKERQFYMLAGLPKLKILVLGPKTNIKGAGLDYGVTNLAGDIISLNGNSKWIDLKLGSFTNPNGQNRWTAREFQSKYNGDADTYYRYGTARSQYQDEDGNLIASDEILVNIIGEGYSAPKEKNINGYSFKEKRGDTASGILDDDEKVVTYIYTKNVNNQDNIVASILKSSVVVHYQDENGNQIATDEMLTGKIGERYVTVKKSIPKYTFKEVNGNAMGLFDFNNQTVIYIYTKDDIKTTMSIKPITKFYKKHKQSFERSLLPINEVKGEIPELLPHAGVSKENNSLLIAIGGMVLLISSIGGVIFRKSKKH